MPDGKIVNMRLGHVSADRRPVYLYRPTLDHRMCFLVAEVDSSAQLHLHPQHSVGCIVPVCVAEDKAKGEASLYSPKTGAFLTIAPIAEGEIEGAMAFSAMKVLDWEKVELHPTSNDVVGYSIEKIIALLDRLMVPFISVDRFLEVLKDKAEAAFSASVFSAVAMCLTAKEWEEFAAKVVDEGNEIAGIVSELFPQDLSAQFGIVQTIEALSKNKEKNNNILPSRFDLDTDKTANTKTVDRVFDALPQGVTFVKDLSFSASLNYRLRKMVKPNQRACIVTSARNEGLYLLEWISYHRLIGFDHIFIYSNDNSDGSDELLGALANLGVITWLRNDAGEGVSVQTRSFAHALSILPDVLEYEWTAILDLDEFFIPNSRFGNITAFLDWHDARPVDAIAINWKMIEPGLETRWRDELLMRRFRLARRSVDAHIKTIFRTSLFVHSLPHFPTGPWGEEFVFRNASGEIHQYDRAVGAARSLNHSEDKAIIGHYFFKSNEEMIWKGSRNRGGEKKSSANTLSGLRENFIRDFVGWTERPTEVLDLDGMAAKTDAEKAGLLGNPQVKEAWEKVKRAFSEQIEELVGKAFTHPSVISAGTDGVRFMAPFADRAGRGHLLSWAPTTEGLGSNAASMTNLQR